MPGKTPESNNELIVLVKNGDWTKAPRIMFAILEQGYLTQDDKHVVRIRTDGCNSWLTIKSAEPGMTRAEYEYEIPYKDALELLDRCSNRVEKERHTVIEDKLGWEVDIFAGDNYGLMIAEIELTSEDVELNLPSWVGKEVTEDERYYNANLAEHPYRSW